MSTLFTPTPRAPLLLAGAAAAAASIWSGYRLYRAISADPSPNSPEIIPSPLKTLLPDLSKDEIENLPYPPDVYPGARDVETPYSSIRVYEWGPEDGRKVLLVHGISMPSITLAKVAERLVEQGCRVMLFDLFGRGYSSSPSTLVHDIRLYTTQILLVLSSSPLSWTGSTTPPTPSPRFTLIGYSLGGCIATHFTATFPHLISHLVLLAPAGLIRTTHLTIQSRLLYSNFGGLLPERFTEFLIARRLSSNSSPNPQTPAKSDIEAQNLDPWDNTTNNTHQPSIPYHAHRHRNRRTSHKERLPLPPSPPPDTTLFPSRPTVSVAGAVDWQIRHHAGFIPAFISCIRHMPIHHQGPIYARIARRLNSARANNNAWYDDPSPSSSASSEAEKRVSSDEEVKGPGLDGKVLVVLGSNDPIIIAREYREDVVDALGVRNVEVLEVDAGHEVPITGAERIVEGIGGMWEGGWG
ncbi:MAG: hypothetical protein M1820_005875 [Bogoriella megaspora]|nr:MAG: hypothetical protein M1820_005875 [Bogoriella megaspora]